MLNFDPSRQPAAPGVYLMKDAAGAILYVGKAKNLPIFAWWELTGRT